MEDFDKLADAMIERAIAKRGVVVDPVLERLRQIFAEKKRELPGLLPNQRIPKTTEEMRLY